MEGRHQPTKPTRSRGGNAAKCTTIGAQHLPCIGYKRNRVHDLIFYPCMPCALGDYPHNCACTSGEPMLFASNFSVGTRSIAGLMMSTFLRCGMVTYCMATRRLTCFQSVKQRSRGIPPKTNTKPGLKDGLERSGMGLHVRVLISRRRAIPARRRGQNAQCSFIRAVRTE